MSVSSEQKIIRLCTRVTSLQDSPEFEHAVQELRAAIGDHFKKTRDLVADLAFQVAAHDEQRTRK
jgi:hypothetical protein